MGAKAKGMFSTMFVVSLGLAGFFLALPACRSADPLPRGALLPPLQALELSVPAGVLLEVPVGATRARPVLFALVEAQARCASFAARSLPAFVLCHSSEDPSASGATELRLALAALKRRVPEYLGAPPVAVYVTAARTEGGMRLVSEEPAFFASLALEKADPISVSNTRLHAFGVAGGARVFLVGGSALEAARLAGAGRGASFEFRQGLGPADALGFILPSVEKGPAASR